MEYILDFLDTFAKVLIDAWFYAWDAGLRKGALCVVGMVCLTAAVIWLTNKAGGIASHRH
jgi:hypothetical protein